MQKTQNILRSEQNIFTLTEIAAEATCNPHILLCRIRLGEIPGASVSLGDTRKYFTSSDKDKMVAYFEKGVLPLPKIVRGEISIREMSRRCGVAYDTLKRWASEGHVLSPVKRIGRVGSQRRYYAEGDVEVVQRQIREIPPKEIRYLSPPPPGCYTIRSAALASGATEASVTQYIKRGG